jgi:MFS family permease
MMHSSEDRVAVPNTQYGDLIPLGHCGLVSARTKGPSYEVDKKFYVLEDTIINRRSGILSNRSFRLYFAGQGMSFIGDGLRSLAIPLLVFHLTGSALSLGITYALEFLPFALAGLVGGSLADRLDRRQLMIVCTVVRFVIIVTLIAGALRGFLSLALIYSGIVVISVAAAIFMGGEASSIPYTVGKDKATQAVSTLIAAEQGANLIAPPIGGALYSIAGPVPALIVNAVTYLLSLGAIAAIPTLGPEAPGPLPTFAELRADITQGFRFLWADKVMRTITLMSLGLNLFGMMAMAIYIPFYKIALGASDAQVGLTLGISAVGSICGSLLAGVYAGKWPFGKAISVAYAIDGLIFVPVVFLHSLWLVVLFWALASGSAAFSTTQIVSWRMRIIPQESISRVFGAVRLIVLIGVVPGTVLGGYLADHYYVRLPVIVSTFGYLVLASMALSSPAVWRDNR